ncbi:MAG: hypothetical protein DRO88_04625 [Promethearchaeia archaeon]|nr:MAG: hypothetical protein DRO88_04625 [Candidatus Lokiarchaeia archaeon]
MKNRKVFVLNPTQSKRLIAKGVISLPQVQQALHEGKIYISRGSTNAYVLEEFYQTIGQPREFNKGDFVAGQIVPNGPEKFMKWWVNKGNRLDEVLFVKGKPAKFEDRVKEIRKFTQGDLFIKGANALDLQGIPAVLVGGKDGGTIGTLQGILQAKGIEIICPIGLEKLVFHPVSETQFVMGMEKMDTPMEGIPCGLIPMISATVITEIEAMEALFECEVFHVASGGVGGAEGCISLLVDAYDDAEMKRIIKFMEKIAREPIYQPNT